MSVDYVIQHAAPTLAGIKTGNLFPCFFSSPQAMVRTSGPSIRSWFPGDSGCSPCAGTTPGSFSISFARRRSPGIYPGGEARPGSLRQAGYQDLPNTPASGSSSGRLQAGEPFPMRSASFLGYPPEDVAGFMTHQGKHCKCVGCWKVYGDEAAARRQFAAYKSCTANYCRRRASGASLEGLTVATRLPQ